MTSDVELQKVDFITVLQTIIYFFVLGLLFGVVILLDNRLPTPLTLDDESKYLDSFIAERAQNDLMTLTKNGPRIVGSFENEIGTVNFLFHELTRIAKHALPDKDLEVEIQTLNGSYYIDYKPFGAYNVYGNIQNIIAKINANNFSGNSILVNAHFDSVPTSPGGSDDGIMCAVMLEVIRKLCQSNEKFIHNIIFLFNGAEETPLQASHGFITQYKLAKEIKVVINLEAAGSGGKEILFQSGPNYAWLLNYYSKVPHPHGQVAGEEIFQSNLIPSDTDFRIFRDYGHTVGFDLAFYKNGYRYHTNYDDAACIPLGSFQHVGDNVLALVKAIVNAPEVQHMYISREKAIYFDILGLFMINYTEYIGIIINSLVILYSCLTFYICLKGYKLGANKRSKIYILVTPLAIIIGWGTAGVGVISIGIIVDILNYSMSWYANPYLILGLYVIPTIMFSCLPVILWNYFNKKLHFSTRVQSQIQFSIVRLIWTVILLVMTCLKIRSAYALMIPVLFNTVGSTVIHVTKLHHSANGWKIAYLLFNVLPTMIILYQFIMVLSLFIPITGRIGNDKNPEIIVGLITMGLTILFSSFFIHFLVMMKKPLWLIYFFLVAFLINFLIIVTPFGFPYSGSSSSPAQQRFMIYHTKRVFNNNEGVIKEDSGYFLVNLDRNSPRSVIPYVRQLEKRVSIKDDCNNFLVCGLPLFSPRMLAIMESISTWIPAEEPVIKENIALQLNSKLFLQPNLLSFNLTVTGPDHLYIYLSPKKNVRLMNISFDNVLPENAPIWNGRPIYFVNFAHGSPKMPLEFSFDLEVPENWNNTSIDVAISGMYVHEKKNQYTVQFKAFLEDFPKWSNIVAGIANFELWEI